jgi:hypothetical protein
MSVSKKNVDNKDVIKESVPNQVKGINSKLLMSVFIGIPIYLLVTNASYEQIENIFPMITIVLFIRALQRFIMPQNINNIEYSVPVLSILLLQLIYTNTISKQYLGYMYFTLIVYSLLYLKTSDKPHVNSKRIMDDVLLSHLIFFVFK